MPLPFLAKLPSGCPKISRRSMQYYGCIFSKSGGKRWPRRPILAPLIFPLPGTLPWRLLLFYRATKQRRGPSPEARRRRDDSSRTSPSLLEAFDLAIHTVMIAVTCCTPSTAPPSPGIPRTTPTTTTCARPCQNPRSPMSTSLLFSLAARSWSNDPYRSLKRTGTGYSGPPNLT
jgi:hypothetical protein